MQGVGDEGDPQGSRHGAGGCQRALAFRRAVGRHSAREDCRTGRTRDGTVLASPPVLDVPPAPVLSPKGMAGRSSTGGLSALQLALSTEADRGTLFLFVPILLAAGSLAYFTAPSEPAFFIVALIVVLGVSFAKLETWRAGTKCSAARSLPG